MNSEPASLEAAVPEDFDIERHDDTCDLVGADKDSYPASWEQFHPAWRAVPLRLAWTTEHDRKFTESINNAGSAPEWPDRYIQERELFTFFVSGVSVIEVACYAIYAVGSIASPKYFPISFPGDLRRISPHPTRDRLKKAFPKESLTNCVHSVITDKLLVEWKRIRNSLIHYAAPSRTFNRSVGSSLPPEGDSWNHPGFSIPLDTETTHKRQKWLVKALGKLESELHAFVRSHLGQVEQTCG